jgi:transcription elongation factor GreB
MNKAFTKESDNEDDELDVADEAAHDPLEGARNYITPAGLQRLRDELKFLLTC